MWDRAINEGYNTGQWKQSWADIEIDSTVQNYLMGLSLPEETTSQTDIRFYPDTSENLAR